MKQKNVRICELFHSAFDKNRIINDITNGIKIIGKIITANVRNRKALITGKNTIAEDRQLASIRIPNSEELLISTE